MQLFSSVTSKLFTFTVRFWAHSKAKNLTFHFRVQEGRRLCPLQPPGRCWQLPARNELRRKRKWFFPSFTKFWLNIGVATFLGQFYEFTSLKTIFNPFTTEEKCFFEKKYFSSFAASPRPARHCKCEGCLRNNFFL